MCKLLVRIGGVGSNRVRDEVSPDRSVHFFREQLLPLLLHELVVHLVLKLFRVFIVELAEKVVGLLRFNLWNMF